MKFILIDKIKESENVWSFLFKPQEPIDWKPGQFITYRIPHKNPDNRGITRHFTISSAPFEKNIMLTSKFDVKTGSSFKKALLNLKVGSKVEAFNLKGKFTIKDLKQKYVFIAGGIGITPFRAILLDLANKNEAADIILIYGNRDEDIVFKINLDKLESEHEWLTVHYVIEPQFIDENIIKEKITDIYKRVYYLSGPFKMVKIIKDILLKIGIENKNILQDYFPGYHND